MCLFIHVFVCARVCLCSVASVRVVVVCPVDCSCVSVRVFVCRSAHYLLVRFVVCLFVCLCVRLLVRLL